MDCRVCRAPVALDRMGRAAHMVDGYFDHKAAARQAA